MIMESHYQLKQGGDGFREDMDAAANATSVVGMATTVQATIEL
jgi:hypothetical protein